MVTQTIGTLPPSVYTMFNNSISSVAIGCKKLEFIFDKGLLVAR